MKVHIGKNGTNRAILSAAVATIGMFATRASAGNDIWLGNTSANWATAANWTTLPVTGDSLEFKGAGSSGSTLIDDLMMPGTFSLAGITFDAGASAFIINPAAAATNGFTLNGGITNNGTNLETILDPITLGAADTITLGTGGGNVALSGIVSGNGSIVTAGTGALTLSGVNTYTGGTTLSAGTQLNLNSSAALGATASVFTINGGTLDNTSAAAKTLTPNNTVALNADLTFLGTQNLNLGTGAVTIGGTGTVRTVTVNANTLTLGPITGTGFGFTKAGAGALTMSGNGSTVTGDLNVTGGTLNIGAAGGDFTAGGLAGTGTIQDGTATTRWLFINNAANDTFAGTLTNGSAGGQLGLVKRGAGSLTLTGTNNPNSFVGIDQGTLNVTQSFSSTGGINIGNTAAANAALVIAPGATFNAGQVHTYAWEASLQVGTAAGAAADVQVNAGSTLSVYKEFTVGNGPAGGAYGAYNQVGGTTTVGGFLTMGLGTDTSVYNQTGGTFTLTNGPATIGAQTNGLAVLNLGGTALFTDAGASNNEVWIGENGTGIMTVSGNAQFVSPSNGLEVGRNGGSFGTVNLDGGAITAVSVFKGAGTGTLNLNGGTLRANTNNANFLTGLTNVYVNANGVTIDDAGKSITIAQPLLAPAGSGVSASGLTVSGSGLIDTPAVSVTGGGGTGATAVATVDATGNLTGINITNPGVGYTSVPTFALLGGGVGNTAAIGGTATLVTNISGGLTKVGTGVLTMTGSSTYSGATAVNAGTLILNAAGSINGSSGITVNGSGAKLIQISSAAITAPVTITNGGLDGTGTLSTVTVADALGNTITHGNGGAGSLTVGSLTFNGAATLNLKTSVALATTPGLATTTLGTGATAGQVKLNVADADPTWANGVYDLVSYMSLTGVGFSDFSLGSISGLSSRQSAVLTNVTGATNYIALTISGVSGAPVWTGALNGNWTTATLAAPKNFTLNGSPTDFANGDNVLFDDTAAGTTAVNISSAVAPSTTTFNNSSLAYTVSSTGGFGISGGGSLTKNGSASLTLASNNTYTGGTIVNAGTLVLSGNNNFGAGGITVNAGTATISGTNTFSGGTTLNGGTLNINSPTGMGSSALTIAGGTIDNTTAGPLALTTTTPENWNGDFTFTGTNPLDLGTGAITLSATHTLTVANSTLTVGGAINGTGPGLNKAGTGTLVLTGSNTYTGPTAVSAGTLSITGGKLGTLNSDIQISPNPGDAGTVSISGGTVNDFRMIIGGNSANGGTPGSGTLLQSGGTINSNAWFSVGSGQSTATPNALTGTYTMTGGTLNVIGQQMEIANFAQTTGIVTMSGASNINIENNNFISMGANGGAANGTFTQNAGNVTFYSDGGTTVGGSGTLFLGRNGAGVYTYNLNGGTLTVPLVAHATGTGNFNFNGGTLKAAAPSANFMNVTTATVLAGGAKIDDGGFAVTLTQPLLSGVASDGGLTKSGAGTLTLSAISSYNGATTINAGSLQIGSKPAPVLVAAYSFDNTAATPVGTPTTVTNSGSGGAAMNGTVGISGGVTIVPNGPIINGVSGNALAFDGSGGTVSVANAITDLSGTGSWTVSTWIKTTEAGATMLSKSTNGTWGNGNSVFYLSDGTGGANANGAGPDPTAVRYGGLFLAANPAPVSVVDGAWHMVTYVGNAGTRTIYVDGVARTLVQTGFNTPDIGNQVDIGFTPDTFLTDGSLPLLGSLDDLNMFSGALSASQIQNLYTTNVAGVASTPPNTLPATTAVNITASGATLDLNGNAQTIGSLTGVVGGVVALGGGVLTVGDATNTTYAGIISDSGGAMTSAGGGIVKQGAGTLTLSGPSTYSGSTTVNAGTLALTVPNALPAGTSLSIASGASTVLASHASGPNGVLQVNQVNFSGTTGNWGGLLDLNNNDVLIHNGVLADVTNQIKQGYNGGAWTGTGGIISTSAANNPSHLTTLGVILNDAGGGRPLYGVNGTLFASFDGTVPLRGDILVKYTYYGDANLDGAVDGSDYTLIDNGFHNLLSGWKNGDFNYDGKIDGSDYTLIDNAFNRQGSTLGSNPAALFASSTSQIFGGSSAVPEPATLGLIGIGAIGLMSRRRRRN